MAGSRSPEEVHLGRIESMGPELGELFHKLANEFVWLCWRWSEYVELFGKSPERLRILNSTAPHFFVVVQEVLWYETLLGISRLAGPAKTGSKENLAVSRMLPLIPDVTLRTRVAARLEDLAATTAFAMEWRNKYIAHRDFELVMDRAPTPLPPATLTEVEASLKALAAVLNEVEEHYQNSTTVYDLIRPAQGAEALLYVLRDGLRREEIRREKLDRGDFDPKDWNDDEAPL